MAVKNAPFVTSGNNLDFLPKTPFQILYFDPTTIVITPDPPPDGQGVKETGSNSFISVPAGTMFYVPIVSVDDSPPVLGMFPTSPSDVPNYWFASSQLGSSDSITIDGQNTTIGATYLVGPLKAELKDDSGQGVGTQIITMGVFLTAFSKGAHTVSIMPRFDGAALIQDLRIDYLHSEFTYNVTVQ
jgi:hypothetical protein